jgi:hypothetical protein
MPHPSERKAWVISKMLVLIEVGREPTKLQDQDRQKKRGGKAKKKNYQRSEIKKKTIGTKNEK